MHPPVYFHFPEVQVSLKERKQLKRLISKLFKAEGKNLERVDYVFCTDEYLLKINQQWLQHDTYTDIITFDLSDKGTGGVKGEIYISIDRVRDNARLYHSLLQDELKRVIFHGALHLCGFKDKTRAQQGVMREQEEKWLRLGRRST